TAAVVEERIEAETPDASDVEDALAAVEEPEEPSALQGRGVGEGAVASPPTPAIPRPPTPAPKEAGEPRRPAAKVLASPAVRSRAKELGIDLAHVRPADDGRIRHADLDAFLSYGTAKGYAPVGRTGRDETVKVVGLRRRIAENMAASKRHIPHFAYVEECDVTELEKLRADLNANRGDKPKLTLLPLLIAALCRALPKFPM